MPRKKRRRPQAVTAGLRWRRGAAYYEREHARLEGGRIVKSLRVGRDREDVAIAYASALNTMAERGDWSVIERWRRSELDISDISRAVREGDYARIKRITADGTRLGAAIERFMQRARATLADQSVKDYQYVLAQLERSLGADHPMAQLTIEAAEKFLHEPKETTGGAPWAAQTQSTARKAYRALWNMVIEQEAEAAEKAQAMASVTRNPWKRARVPKRRKTRHAFLTPAQWKHLINHDEVAGTRYAAFLAAGILGLRRREIMYLRTVDDVILNGARPRLRIQDRKGEHKWTAKTENSVRDVPIPTRLRPLFEHHAGAYAGEKFFFRSLHRDSPLSDQTATIWVQSCFVAADLPYGRGDAKSLTLHSLRHTCATWMLSKNVPITTAAKRLGDTPAVLLDTYAHAIAEDEARADAAMDEALV